MLTRGSGLRPESSRYRAKVQHYQSRVDARAGDAEAEEATGLSLDERRRVYGEIMDAQERSVAQASAAVDVVDLATSDQHMALVEKFDAEYMREICTRNGIDDDQIAGLLYEGFDRGWLQERGDARVAAAP